MLAVADIEQLPVQQARTGDPDAWNALFRRYQLPLYAYVQELVRDEQASLDIVQEAFIAATRHLGSLRDDAKFGSWLFGIARQKVVQRWRRPRLFDAFDEEQAERLVEPEANPEEWLVRHEEEELFMKRLGDLPPPLRDVLLLHFLEDFTLDEIAGITGVPVGTVKSRMHHAKRRLRELMTENET
jgi:RNA polymerase sigma-70 factor (ECF subfamily)